LLARPLEEAFVVCGLVGVVGPSLTVDAELLSAMNRSLTHRGPDGGGEWFSPDGMAALAHRRLSIVDLTSTGAQPMVRDGGKLAVVYNGEIYNHQELRAELVAHGVRFEGTSDTEVLLEAYRCWGTKLLSRIRGMFSFAIYDARNRTLFLARDRAGEKPLFWARHRGGVAFASELKALLTDTAFSRRLSLEGLNFFMHFGYVPGDLCILDGVHKLPPAHFLLWQVDKRDLRVERYWDLPLPQAAEPEEEPQLVEELHQLLRASVSEQMHADVPVAVLLSGGIDSSLVTAIAASVAGTRVRTFTVGIPGHASHDETRHARLIANHFGTDHFELAVDRSSIDLIRVLARLLDEPINDSSLIPTYLLSRAVSAHCKVVLGGDGGDELFGGYRAYQGAVRVNAWRARLPSFARALISGFAARFMRVGAPGRNGLIGLRGNLADGVVRVGVQLDDDEIARVAPRLGARVGRHPLAWRRELVEPERGVPAAFMAMDFRTYLPEDILVKVDRASMLNSLEVRAPLLDYRIIEFAFRKVPNQLRTTTGERKRMLRKLAARILPSGFDLDRKQGFTIPLSTWITPQIVRSWRQECHTEISAILDLEHFPGNLESLDEGTAQRLFALMMLTHWMREYRITV
jgi:asparagine synthase (glutamine-hydrolysing)